MAEQGAERNLIQRVAYQACVIHLPQQLSGLGGNRFARQLAHDPQVFGRGIGRQPDKALVKL